MPALVEATGGRLRYTGKMGPTPNELSALEARLDSLRPLSAMQIQRLWPHWQSEDALFIYATNAIEGSTMTLGETTVVIESGITIGGKTVQEHLDIVMVDAPTSSCST